MSTERDYKRDIVEKLKAKAEKDGLDASGIGPEDVQVNTEGPTVRFSFRGASISLPAPSREAFDQWFKDGGGNYIAGALTVVVGVVIGSSLRKS